MLRFHGESADAYCPGRNFGTVSKGRNEVQRGMTGAVLRCHTNAIVTAARQPVQALLQASPGAGQPCPQGEKGTPAIFWKRSEVADRETKARKDVPVLCYCTVFSLDQIGDTEAPMRPSPPISTSHRSRRRRVLSNPCLNSRKSSRPRHGLFTVRRPTR